MEWPSNYNSARRSAWCSAGALSFFPAPPSAGSANPRLGDSISRVQWSPSVRDVEPPARRPHALSSRTLISHAQLKPGGAASLPTDRPAPWSVGSFPRWYSIGPLYFLFTDGYKSTQERAMCRRRFFRPHPSESTYVSSPGIPSASAGLCQQTLYYAFGALAFQLIFDFAAAYISFSKLRPCWVRHLRHIWPL